MLKNAAAYFKLTKPKVVFVMLITAWVGMLLASHEPSLQSAYAHYRFLKLMCCGTLGIAFIAGAAAVLNQLFDKKFDAKMERTASRPLVNNVISTQNALVYALILLMFGIGILYFAVNPLTLYLTLGTLGGYAFIYTVFLKHLTPQNIVIGGLAGAMPPLLGWTAITNTISPYALLLTLIIFMWTPPHFWALAIYRKQEYEKAGIPMLPVTHGIGFTKICIMLYTILLLCVSLLPFVIGMSRIIYGLSALVLGVGFCLQTIRLYFSKKPQVALQTFQISILYLLLLFGALIVDHVLGPYHA